VPTPWRRDYTLWLQIALVALGVSVSGLVVTQRLRSRSAAPAPIPAPVPVEPLVPAPVPIVDDETTAPRQVTVFAIQAKPGASKIDPRLSSVKAQLRKILPDHGFELLEVQSGPLAPGESLACDLGQGWRAETTLLPPSPDEFGRVRLRCKLIEGAEPRFSTEVDAPENQLFFYERELHKGMRVLIGVGAR
jgi:hypothetical protein